MRAVVQRVTSASVSVGGEVVGSIHEGLLVLLGITHDDGPQQVGTMARKLHELRVLRDERSCAETGAALLARGAAVSTGRSGAQMEVALVNDGPVTLLLEV